MVDFNSIVIRPDRPRVFVPLVDSIFITSRINNFDVEKVYLDTVANFNILFIDLLEKIHVRRSLLTLILGPTFGVGR